MTFIDFNGETLSSIEAEDAIIVLDSSNPRPLNVEDASSSILSMLESGMTIQAVAASLNLDIESVSSVRDLALSKDRAAAPVADKLKVWAEQTDDLIDMSHQAAIAEPTPNNLYAYTAVVACGLSIVEALDAKKDPKIVHDEVTASVLEPMVEQIMVAMTEKLAETKKSLDEIIPESKHDELASQLKDVLRALGAVCKDSLDFATNRSLEIIAEKKPATGKIPKKKPRK